MASDAGDGQDYIYSYSYEDGEELGTPDDGAPHRHHHRHGHHGEHGEHGGHGRTGGGKRGSDKKREAEAVTADGDAVGSGSRAPKASNRPASGGRPGDTTNTLFPYAPRDGLEDRWELYEDQAGVERPEPPTGTPKTATTVDRGTPLLERIPGMDDVSTTHEAFMNSVGRFPDRPCLGVRDPDGPEEEETNPYTWQTYRQVHDTMHAFGSGLQQLDDVGAVLGIYSKNTVEWVYAEKAAAAWSMVVVPLYDTLGPEAVEHCIRLTDMTSLVCEPQFLGPVLHAAETCPLLRNVILTAAPVDAEGQRLLESSRGQGVVVQTFDEVVANGRNNLVAFNPPSPDDLVTICFTSGTTGLPKGAMLTHGAMIADVAGAIVKGVTLTEEDVHVSYLPLAHIFERLMQVAMFAHGAAIGFFRGDVKVLVADIGVLKPTIFPSVPRLLNKVYGKVIGKVEAHPGCCGIKRSLFYSALRNKTENLADGENSHWFYDKIFGKVRATLGGRVRILITGSAPLGIDVMNFLRVALVCDVMEGYGQTESSAASTVTDPGDYSTGNVGTPLACVEVALASVPEMGYYATEAEGRESDTPADQVKIGGEICVRGPILMQGYYKNDPKTWETIDREGWLHSGDIGVWLEGSRLKIVDRKKNIFKLAQGEYLAPEKIENILLVSQLVAQMWVYGNSLKNVAVCVVVPDEEYVSGPWAVENAMEGADYADICRHPDLVQAIRDDFARIAAEEVGGVPNLRRFEIPARVHVEPRLWDPQEGDLMTPSFKMRRQNLLAHYQEAIDDLYADVDANGGF